MIIVNQDKDEIVNFDRVESIWVCSDEEVGFVIEATADTNITLGCYKTEERAKEVLQEIVEKYQSCNSSLGSQGYVKNKVCEMPEE